MLEEDQRQIETDRRRMNEDLKQTKESFYKGRGGAGGGNSAGTGKSKNPVVPHYADEVASFEGSNSSSRGDETAKKLSKQASSSIELPCLQAAFGEGDQIVAPKPYDTTKTIYAAKPKNQKKKRKARPVILTDDEPIKQIEIIRSQPDTAESSNPKKSGKQQPAQQQ